MLVIRLVGPGSITFLSLFVDYMIPIFIYLSPLIIVYKIKLIICPQINKLSTDITILDNLLKIKYYIILIFIYQNINEYLTYNIIYTMYTIIHSKLIVHVSCHNTKKISLHYSFINIKNEIVY